MDKKILLLVQLPPPVHGVSVMNELVSKIVKSRWPRSDIVNISSANKLADVGKISGSKIFSIFKVYGMIAKLLKIGTYDACYFTLCPTGVAFYRDVVISIILKLFGVKIIYHLHGKGIRDNSGIINTILYKLVFSNASVIHLSGSLLKDIEGYVNKKDCYIINNCVLGQGGKSLKGVSNKNKVTFLFLSNFVRGKGPMYVLQAARSLSKIRMDFEIILAGQWFEQDLREEIQQWLIDNSDIVDKGLVKIIPPVYGDEKDKLLDDADVKIFPSYIDTFPLVVLEAFQHSLPVISTDEGAIPEMIDSGVNGFILPKHDVVGLSKTMLKFIEDRQLVLSMGVSAREKYEKLYTQKIFENKLMSTLTRILE